MKILTPAAPTLAIVDNDRIERMTMCELKRDSSCAWAPAIVAQRPRYWL